ncbi:hypothetical protein [Marisediminicola senii]|uniref:hypothetical protein n=1 Tax=Marisediminicola senii TaxID=2711233 RepID=UPI0013ECA292|nr:hypothetical protein [Marisediminicola senii]
MAKLGPITGHITVHIGSSPLDIQPVEFDIPLRFVENTSYDSDTPQVEFTGVARTELREQLTETLRTLADRLEASLLAPARVVTTCDVCGAQIASETLATLRHEADGAHSFKQGIITPPRHYELIDDDDIDDAIIDEPTA